MNDEPREHREDTSFDVDRLIAEAEFVTAESMDAAQRVIEQQKDPRIRAFLGDRLRAKAEAIEEREAEAQKARAEGDDPELAYRRRLLETVEIAAEQNPDNLFWKERCVELRREVESLERLRRGGTSDDKD